MRFYCFIGLIVIAGLLSSFGNEKQSASYKAAQNIERLGNDTIEVNEDAGTIAYDFVMSVINEDYDNAVELMSARYYYTLMRLFFEGVTINQIFSTEYTHKIVDMRPVVKLGYEVMVTDVQTIKSDTFIYSGRSIYHVSLDCVNKQNEFYDGSKGDYDTSVTVTVIEENGELRVLGFE